MSLPIRLTRRRALAAALLGSATARVSRAETATPQTGIRLNISPNPVAYDQPVTVRIRGLDAGQQVTVTAEVTDDAGMDWFASGEFTADERGVIDLSTQAPTSGSWATPDPMGLIWSLTALGVPNNTWNYAWTLTPPPLTITVRADQEVLAQDQLVRELETPEITGVAVSQDGLWGQFFRPAKEARYPGVLVLGGSEGGLSPVMLREAALLARHGFAVLALAYFGYASLPPRLERIPLEYFGEALTWLGMQDGVLSDRFGVIGHSRGGELALLLGTRYPAISAVISYVGSGLSMPSPNDPTIPAWTWQGSPVPNYYDPASWNDAAIPVEQIAGPVLLFSGDADRLWPSATLSQLALDRLVANGHPYLDAHHRYPDAGHLIQSPYVPTGGPELTQFGGTAAGMAAANADSWPRVVALLQTWLPPAMTT